MIDGIADGDDGDDANDSKKHCIATKSHLYGTLVEDKKTNTSLQHTSSIFPNQFMCTCVKCIWCMRHKHSYYYLSIESWINRLYSPLYLQLTLHRMNFTIHTVYTSSVMQIVHMSHYIPFHIFSSSSFYSFVKQWQW